MQTTVGETAFPADTAKIDLYHVDAGFFIGLIPPQIILCAQDQILSFSEIAGGAGSAVSGRLARIGTRLHLHEKNPRFIFTNDIGFQMSAAVISVQDRIALGNEITAGEVLARSSDLKLFHFSLFPRRKESFFCARGKDQAQ